VTAPVVASPELALAASDLLSEFEQSQTPLTENLLYYESKKRPQAIGLAVPPEMQKLLANVGWCRVYLDSLEERLDIEGFRLAGRSPSTNSDGEVTNIGDERLWSWWQYNNLDEWSGLGHLEAMIHGRAYITIAAPDPDDPLMDQDKPIIRVEPATSMWADIDPRTQRVTRAVRVVRRADETIDTDRITVFYPNVTYGLVRNNGTTTSEWNIEWFRQHNLGIVPVVPLLNRSRLTEFYGRSEITTELRSVTDAAARIMMDMQGAAEMMAMPQRLLFGVTKEQLLGSGPDAKTSFQAYMGRILMLPDGATSAQFSAAELRNYGDALELLSKEASKYTGLPPQYLYFNSDNPASAEAIRSSETRLVKKSERKQRIFGGAWEQALRIAILMMDNELPADAHRLETVWRNPATPTFAAMADAVVKLVTATTPSGDSVLPVEQGRIELGYSVEQRRQMRQWDQDTPRNQLQKVLTPPIFQEPGQ
jgi:hypothetical protein